MGSSLSRPRVHACLLALILTAAAVVRCVALSGAPPGLNQDEAANAWSAWCLLQTGQDQGGQRWPIFYTHALGENRSALLLYLLLPFQALGGLNVWTTRLPAAVGGVATVALLYVLGRRLFDARVGLIAAALTAFNPWHVLLSRTGWEAGLVPLHVVVGMLALLWAGWPAECSPRPLTWWRALAAGLLLGITCYGYPAVRLFLPPLAVAWAVVTVRGWWPRLRVSQQRVALLTGLLGLAVTFGPLAWQHLAHPERIAMRGARIALWQADAPLGTRIGAIAGRYFAHFDPAFLFARGDRFEAQSTAGCGLFSWYVLPLMIAGGVFVVRRWRDSLAVRVVACAVLLYPAGDLLYSHMLDTPAGLVDAGMHALRSSTGLVPLILLAAYGAAELWRAVAPRWPRAAIVAATCFVLCCAGLDGAFLRTYFGPRNRRPAVYRAYQADLVEGCRWLRPHLAEADAVFITTRDVNMPYIVALVVLGYRPQQWFADVRIAERFAEYEYYFRVGRLHFLYDRTSVVALEELRRNDRRERVFLLVRPDETGLAHPALTIVGPDGRPALLGFVLDL